MTTRGMRQVAGLVLSRLLMDGIPAIVLSADRNGVRIAVGSSATHSDVQRAEEIAGEFAADFGWPVAMVTH